jgi:hypothetical protein
LRGNTCSTLSVEYDDVTQEVAQALIQALVLFRLDYLQLVVVWAPSLCHQTPECCSPPGLQSSQVLSCHPAPPHTLLPVEACINYKVMVLTYGTARGSAAQTLHPNPSIPICQGRAAPAQPSPSSSLSWHPNGGTSFPLKLGQQSPCPSTENICNFKQYLK